MVATPTAVRWLASPAAIELVIAPLLALAMIWRASTLLLLVALVPLVGVVTLAMLPYVKGAVIGAQWALRTPTKAAR